MFAGESELVVRLSGPRPVLAKRKLRLYIVLMQTHTATQARANLTRILSRALRGEDIGIVCEGKIIALRPVEVYSADYGITEYGLTPAELKRAEQNIRHTLKHEKAQPWDGTAQGLRG